jgi:hypothetical protein
MAGDRELQLKATASIEDAKSELEDLKDKTNDLPDEVRIKINIDDEDVNPQVESIKEDIEDIPDEVTTTVDVDGEGAESQIADIKSEIETIEDTVSVTIDANDNASDIADNIKSTIEELDGQISTVTINADGDALEVADEVKTDLEELDGSEVTVTINAEGASETEDDIDGASDAASDYGGILDAIFGAGATAAFSETITSAGNFESSWLKLRSAVGEGDKDMDTVMAEWESAISAMTSSTGRGAGDARDEITALGKAGVTNKQTMIDLFSGVSEASYQTGNSVSSLDDQMRILISQETPRMRTLNRQFGITDETIKNTYGSVDTFKEKWKTASADQRAEMLSTLLNQQYLSDGVADYGDSWEHSVDKAGRSLTWLGIQLGSPLLDAAKSGLNGFADIISGIANALGDLPFPLDLVVSGFVALTSLGTGIKGLGSMLSKVGLDFLANPLTKLGDYMLKPAQKVFDSISKLIPESVKDWKTKIKTFIDDIKNIFTGETPKFKIISEEDGVIEEAKLNSFKSKVSSFVNDIKTKIEEIKGKFKLSDIFGGEEGEGTLNTIKTKIGSFVDDITTKLGKIKETNIWKLLFGDEKGTINLGSTLDDITSRIGKFVDDFGGAFKKINFGQYIDDILSKFKISLPKLETGVTTGLRSTLFSAIGKALDFTFFIQLFVDFFSDITQYLADPSALQGSPQWLIEAMFGGLDPADPIGTLLGPLFKNILPENLRNILSPTSVMRWLIGDEKTDRYNELLEANISKPFRDSLNKIWNDLVKWITNLKFPNLLDLILPQTASAAGEGKDKGNPIDTAINSIKSKINGFKDWLGSLKFSSITDLIFGKQEEGKESPITTFINDIKAKIGGFKDWLGSLKFTNILDTIFGKKSDQKEDPATTFINGIKTKLNDLKTYVQNKANEIKSALTIDWSKIETGLNEAKQWVMDRWNEIKTYLKTKIDEIKSLINIPWEKIYDGLQAAIDTAEAIFNLFSAYMEVLGTKAKKWGADIVQGLIDGITSKIPSLEDALNYIKNYFPTSPPKKGPLSAITAQGAADWINNALITPLANSIVSFNDYLRDVMPDSIQHHGLDTSYNNTPSSIARNQGNTAITSSGTSGWEMSPISDWTNSLNSGINSLSDFSSAISSTQMALANLASQSLSGGTGIIKNVPSQGTGIVKNVPSQGTGIVKNLSSQGTRIFKGEDIPEKPTLEKISITFESGAFSFGSGDKNTVKQAVTDALTNPTTLSKMRMQMRMKGIKPKTIVT